MHSAQGLTAADTRLCIHQKVQVELEFALESCLNAGESYGGQYVPLLAQAIADARSAGIPPVMNLKVCNSTFSAMLMPETSILTFSLLQYERNDQNMHVANPFGWILSTILF